MSPTTDALVSVVIPHYNRASLLKQAIESVLRSTDDRFEIVVVDDLSSDDQFAQIIDYQSERVRLLRRENGPKGPSRCRNIGARESRGSHLLFLDSDDLLAPWGIEQRLARADKTSADVCVFPVVLFENEPGDSDVLWNELSNGIPNEVRFMASDPPWHTSSTLWTRKSFDRVGGFNERIIYGDDSDLHLRALLTGLEFEEFADDTPDVFVRRSTEPRITNTLRNDIASMRSARLTEGTTFLKSAPGLKRYLPEWAAQYFMEAEWLLFNAEDPAQARDALSLWRTDLGPENAPPNAAKSYIELAIHARRRAYFLVRLARRIAMLLLPRGYFPTATGFHSHSLTGRRRAELRARLTM